MRVFFYRLKRCLKRRKNKKLYGYMVCLLCITVLFTVIDHKISNIVVSLSETAVRSKTAELLNKGFAVSFDEVEFNDIYNVRYSDNGNISGLFLNSMAVNKIKASVLENANSYISNGDNTVKIPIGNVFGGGLLSGRGKNITVKLLSVTALTGEIINKTEDSGVNQTHLSSYINIKAEVCARVYGENIITSTESEILLCDSVIVGRVPDTFVKVNVLDEETLDWLKSYK